MSTNEPETKRVVPTWRRLLVAAGWFALLLVAVSAVVYFSNHHRLTNHLDRLMAELDESDPGWRWPTPFQVRPAIPYEENSVPRILAILNDRPRGWPEYKKWQPFENLQPNVELDPPRRKLLAELVTVAPVPQLRERARELVKYPHGQIEVKLAENPWATLLPNHQKMRDAATLLNLDAQALALDGRHGEALKASRACLNVSRALEEDRFVIGQLVRFAVAGIALSMAERTMALGEAPDDALAELQKHLEREASGVRITAALRGERAASHQTLTLLASGKITLAEMQALIHGGSPSWTANWLSSFAGRGLARREQGNVLRLMTQMVEASKLAASDQFAAEEEFDNQFRSASTGTIMRIIAPFAQKAGEEGRRLQSLAVAMRALIAVERYRLKHGKWPDKLEDIVPAFLEKVPLDPIDDKPIRYRKWAEGVVVYSIGNNRTDDGGNVVPPFKDFGYRLWDKDKRRAAPPPDMPP